MLKSIRKYCFIMAFAATCCLGLGASGGCVNRQPHHDGNNIEWIEKQVKEGKLTRAQADELIKQQKEAEE